MMRIENIMCLTNGRLEEVVLQQNLCIGEMLEQVHIS